MNYLFYDIGVAATLILCFLIVAVIAYCHGVNVGHDRGKIDCLSKQEGGAK